MRILFIYTWRSAAVFTYDLLDAASFQSHDQQRDMFWMMQ